jgi:hypothetical protein
LLLSGNTSDTHRAFDDNGSPTTNNCRAEAEEAEEDTETGKEKIK